jgi:hypothetical protein
MISEDLVDAPDEKENKARSLKRRQAEEVTCYRRSEDTTSPLSSGKF